MGIAGGNFRGKFGGKRRFQGEIIRFLTWCRIAFFARRTNSLLGIDDGNVGCCGPQTAFDSTDW